MRFSVNLAIIALYNRLCRRVFVFLISAVLTIRCNVKTLISQFAVYIFGEVVVFLFVLHPLFRAFAELTILALFCFYRMRPAVVRYVFRTVKIQEKVAVAGVKGIYIFTARIRVNSVNGIYRTAILTN